MTTAELKQKIIDKAAEMLENVKSCEELKAISEVYGELTKEDWTRLMVKMLNEKANEPNIEPFPTGLAFPLKIEGTETTN